LYFAVVNPTPNGSTENAEPENAGLENSGPKNAGVENGGPENAGPISYRDPCRKKEKDMLYIVVLHLYYLMLECFDYFYCCSYFRVQLTHY